MLKMPHFRFFRLIFASEEYQIFVDIIDISIRIISTLLYEFLVLDQMSVVEEVIILFEGKHFINEVLIVYFS